MHHSHHLGLFYGGEDDVEVAWRKAQAQGANARHPEVDVEGAWRKAQAQGANARRKRKAPGVDVEVA